MKALFLKKNFFQLFSFTSDFLARFVRIALPVIINETLWSIGITTENAIFSHAGTDAIAAFNITGTISQLTWVFFIGVGNGAGIIIGKKIGEDMQNALTPKYYGTWVYEGASAVTTVEIKQDKMMTVMQRAALDTQYWSGTYSATRSLIVFTVEKSGTDTGYSKSESDDGKTWRILYSLDEGNGTLTIRCSHIPTDKDGHDFSDPTIFKKQK